MGLEPVVSNAVELSISFVYLIIIISLIGIIIFTVKTQKFKKPALIKIFFLTSLAGAAAIINNVNNILQLELIRIIYIITIIILMFSLLKFAPLFWKEFDRKFLIIFIFLTVVLFILDISFWMLRLNLPISHFILKIFILLIAFFMIIKYVIENDE